MSLWLFYKSGIDIARLFSEGPEKVKFLIVAIDYFIKWIEAKSLATITGNHIKKSVWDNIVCRFGLPGEIISDNGKHNRDTPFSLTYGTKAVIPAEIGMPILRTIEVDLVQNDEALGINLDLFEEKSKQQYAKQRAKKRWKNTTTPKFKVHVSNWETLCTVTAMQAVQKTQGSWAPNGKKRTKLWKHLGREHIS
nr:reverse transcriptase domain-containing protein [Tanacetum cinerariifolium]